jgi:hypothetical protein
LQETQYSILGSSRFASLSAVHTLPFMNNQTPICVVIHFSQLLWPIFHTRLSKHNNSHSVREKCMSSAGTPSPHLHVFFYL